MAAADKEALNALHEALAKALKEEITKVNEEGARNASMLNVARQFLKDNGIEAAVVPGKPLAALKDEFPFDVDDVPDARVRQ